MKHIKMSGALKLGIITVKEAEALTAKFLENNPGEEVRAENLRVTITEAEHRQYIKKIKPINKIVRKHKNKDAKKSKRANRG